MKIEKNEVKKFLASWTKGVIEIGKAHEEQKNFTEVAINFLNHHYAFEEDDVMFKPTFTSIDSFEIILMRLYHTLLLVPLMRIMDLHLSPGLRLSWTKSRI
tara:strand:- start:355 stop:657 length:303 start_codon:yes stop_codon:yes gene_type:complete